MEFRVPLVGIIEFLNHVLKSEKGMADVTIDGEGLVHFLGQKLPGAGTLNSMTIEFPYPVPPAALKIMLKYEDLEDFS